jgi:hypothetical protein
MSNRKQLAFLQGRELSFLGHRFVAEFLLRCVDMCIPLIILFIGTHATNFGLFDRELL